jgi:hypothetical protein
MTGLSELFLGFFIIGAVTAIIVVLGVVLGRREDREAKSRLDTGRGETVITRVEEISVTVTEFGGRRA